MTASAASTRETHHGNRDRGTACVGIDVGVPLVAAAGFEDSSVPNEHPHRKRVYFNDAEGNDWEFVQYFSSDPAERNDYELPD